jgi:hypothetical protein
MVNVCGETLLVSAKSLQNLCPYVTVLNDSSAFLWERLKNGADVHELETAVCEEYDVEDPTAVHEFIEDFLETMNEYHYLISVDQGECHE